MNISFCSVVLSLIQGIALNTDIPPCSQGRGATDKVSIFIGFQQTQYVELHNDDLDHDRQLTRSKHETHGGKDNHLATAMDP
jgi:hypothetical protein